MERGLRSNIMMGGYKAVGVMEGCLSDTIIYSALNCP